MYTKSSQLGFTLIEMIVSLAVFSGVVTIAVGALLVLVGTNEQLQGEQSVMTNLSFALDSMTREIRTGTDYYCYSRASYSTTNMFGQGNNLDSLAQSTLDCSGSTNTLHGISFTEGGDSITQGNDRIVYFHDASNGQLYRRVGTAAPVSIISSSIYIHQADFYVTGSCPLSDTACANNLDQASVTVFIEASEDVNTPAAERYQIQTTVSQRTLDI